MIKKNNLSSKFSLNSKIRILRTFKYADKF